VAAYGSLGLTPDGGMTWLLPRLVGLRMAQDLLINNRLIKAPEALELGMISQLAEEGELHTTGMAVAAKLAAGPVAAVGGVKRLLLDTFRETYEDQLDHELDSICAAGGRPEGREGVSAFIAKRTPDFKGCMKS
jgi:2-(1,2-epoxy-1,2-dihydrophenyl)acetyl-CoA isomerase